VLKDKHFYEQTGGGVTLSGGEPLLFADFTDSFFRKLREYGITTALDTCGLAHTKTLLKLLAHTDILLYDIKLIDDSEHIKLTGNSNKKILENLITAAEYIRQKQADKKRNITLWIRTPLIPGATASEENISRIAAFIADNLQDVTSRWELCSFNPACQSKYARLGLTWVYSDLPPLTRCTIDKLIKAAKTHGISEDILIVTGIMKGEF
jgi:pyruvate formate lyase activating enzyme